MILERSCKHASCHVLLNKYVMLCYVIVVLYTGRCDFDLELQKLGQVCLRGVVCDVVSADVVRLNVWWMFDGADNCCRMR